MAEQEKPKLALPWGTLLPLIAVLAGIIAQYKPLVSSRPAAPGEKSIEAIAEQDVDARLWQDPLAAARKEMEAHEAEALTALAQSDDPDALIDRELQEHRHDLKALADLIKKEMDAPVDKILLLAVMLDAGPYIEQSESRLRTRRAVLEGLSQSGFAPVDAEHIGFATSKWPPPEEGEHQSRLLIPWEECRAMDKLARVHPRGTGRVFILWLPAANFNPLPLSRFAALIKDLTHRVDHQKINVKLIGPTNSGGLQSMIQEVRAWTPGKAERDHLLDGVSIISPRATVMDEALLYDLLLYDQRQLDASQQAPPNLSVEAIIEQGIAKGPRGGLHFVRTIAQDDVVLGQLIDELKLRKVEVKKSSENDGNHDQIVILTEWDSAYGRTLARTFEALASGLRYKELVEQGQGPIWIHSYQYLRGIDGRLPGEEAKAKEQESKQSNQNAAQPKLEEATEGMDQSDFLRRLARELKERDASFQRQHKGRIRAIGLLGSDIYDKLMILRALRPEFPEAIFFTNNFDAHFERRADWADARNLVIASPFGSQVPKWQFDVTPFRDSTQTSMYMATLVATERMKKDTVMKLTNKVRVFEIGRRGAYDLNSPQRHWFREWLRPPLTKTFLALAILTLLAMTVWLSLGIVDSRFPLGGTLGEHFTYLLCNTPFWLVWGSAATILLVCAFAQRGASQEPLEFFSGISIWPTEMLRLIALLLSVHFMIKASFCLRANEKEIAERFCLDPLPATDSRWRNFLQEGLTRWQRAHAAWLKPDAEFSAEEAWHAYLRRNQFWPRVFRVALLFSIYFIFMAALISLFMGRVPSVPARGRAAFFFNSYTAYCSGICLLVLSFYVVDAIELNGNFIRVFTRGLTRWKSGVSARCKRVPPLSEEDLSRYHDVFFVAQRTEGVARLVWYPLIVLATLVVARSSFFANWTWPPVLILTFALNAVWAVGSAIFLRHTAEQLRTTAIENLQLLRLANYSAIRKGKAFDELIAEIRSLKKGAFAPLSEQPFIRAMLLPGAGLGLLAVGQRLLEGF